MIQSQSPNDLNANEDLWTMLKGQAHARNPTNLNEVYQSWQEEVRILPEL